KLMVAALLVSVFFSVPELMKVAVPAPTVIATVFCTSKVPALLMVALLLPVIEVEESLHAMDPKFISVRASMNFAGAAEGIERVAGAEISVVPLPAIVPPVQLIELPT